MVSITVTDNEDGWKTNGGKLLRVVSKSLVIMTLSIRNCPYYGNNDGENSDNGN